jgi:hypothetical protein
MAVNREQNLVYEPQLDPLITDEEFLEYKQQILSFLATLVRTETLTADEWGVRFNDGSFFIQANEALGIHGTKMAHLAASIPASALDQTARALIGGGARVVELDQSIGWAFAAYYEATREVAFGIRNDGTMYPPQVSTALPGVTLHGDSLAAGWAAYNMTGDLAVATGRAVTVDAIGGQRTAQAAARQGGAPALLTVAGNTIPASGPVDVTGWSVDLLAPPISGFSTIVGSLGGVKGTLRGGRDVGATVSAYTFTRAVAGIAMPVPPGTPFATGAAEGALHPSQ